MRLSRVDEDWHAHVLEMLGTAIPCGLTATAPHGGWPAADRAWVVNHGP